MTKKDEAHTKYLIKTHGDTFAIEIASTWKITFSSVNPNSNQPGRGYCVRVYEMPGSKLRAVFDSVISIRDLGIPLLRKTEKETGSATWSYDSEAGFEEHKKVDRESQYILDAPKVEF